jgi:hypothetical protein
MKLIIAAVSAPAMRLALSIGGEGDAHSSFQMLEVSNQRVQPAYTS